MANAMLQDNFKTSHADLMKYGNENDVPGGGRGDGIAGEGRESGIDHHNPHHHHQQYAANGGTGSKSILVHDDRSGGGGCPSRSPCGGMLRKHPGTAPSIPTRKSVDFAILPPPKRLRSAPVMKWTAKHVVDAISTSIAPEERMEAIQNTKDAFDHSDQEVHDEEIGAGADAALAKHLTFLVWHVTRLQTCTKVHTSDGARGGDDYATNTFHCGGTQYYSTSCGRCPDHPDLDSLMVEIAITCEAAEAMYRASSHIVEASFHRMGLELLNLLVTIITNEIGRRIQAISNNTASSGGDYFVKREDEDQDKKRHQQEEDGGGYDGRQSREPGTASNDYQNSKGMRPITPTGHDQVPSGTPEGDLILRKATKILGHFARVGSATRPIAHFPGLLGCLISIVNLRPHDSVPWEARLSALWTLANLACNHDNMQMMVCTPGLLTALIEVSRRPLHTNDDLETTMEVLRSRSIASRAVMNLSWAPENKIPLSEHPALIEMLAELTVQRTATLNRSRTVQSILVTTRRHAIGALRNLAAAPRRTKIRLCEYRDGKLLDVLTDAALNDTDTAVKDRAFATIHNLASQDTAARIVGQPALILALKEVMLSDEGGPEQEEGSPKSHAAATLMVLERTITPSMKSSYENLRDVLDALKPPVASDNGSENENDSRSTSEEMETIAV